MKKLIFLFAVLALAINTQCQVVTISKVGNGILIENVNGTTDYYLTTLSEVNVNGKMITFYSYGFPDPVRVWYDNITANFGLPTATLYVDSLNSLGYFPNTEADPIFISHLAYNITAADTTWWGASETDPVFTTHLANDITEADTTRWGAEGGGDLDSVRLAFLEKSNTFTGDSTIFSGRFMGGSGSVASGDYSFAWGVDNTASGDYSAVLSGGDDGSGNTVSGEHSVIVGGYDNSVTGDYSVITGTGYENIISGEESVIAGGSENEITGNLSVISGGYQNQANGRYSVISGGWGNTASNFYASVINGEFGFSDKFGQLVTNSIAFNGLPGSAQSSALQVSDTVTHDANVWHNLYTNGMDGDSLITIAAKSAWTFEIRVVGNTANSAKVWSYTITGAIKRDNAGNTTLLGSTVAVVYESDADFDCQVVADDTNEALLVQVKDATYGGDNVRWVATVSTTEVIF